ncbi:hypothetical protein H6G91_11590 [Nostoc muscorum FACHB-395]|uniref:hypothetical protein n=1 Tax=Nostoc sp. C057 TaxID=2576903 RepID=UPI0015C401C0|nr:hypothetical protein [Nostoc sp. C057]MBD2507912.1 hypothetical protein [Desmonostoc muscorum FACHB-395]
MKRNPTLPPDLCWVTRSLHPTYKTTVLNINEVYRNRIHESGARIQNEFCATSG